MIQIPLKVGHHRPMMAQHWMMACFFRGYGPVLLKNPIVLRIFRGGGPHFLSPSWSTHACTKSSFYKKNWAELKPMSIIYLTRGMSLVCIGFLSCVCCAFVPVCLLVPCGHLLGKGWPLGSRLYWLTVSLLLLLSHWYPGFRDGTWLYRFLIFALFLTFIWLLSVMCLLMRHMTSFQCFTGYLNFIKEHINIERKAKIRNWYNQVQYPTQNTIWESERKHNSQEAIPFPAGDHKTTMNRQYSMTKI